MGKKLSGPQFLISFLTDKHLDENLVKVFMPKAYPLIYCCYMAISDIAEIDKSWIEGASFNKDEQEITLKMDKSKHAKLIKKECDNESVEYGKHSYLMNVSLSDNYVIIKFIEE